MRLRRQHFMTSTDPDDEYVPRLTLEYALATLQDLADFISDKADDADRSALEYKRAERDREYGQSLYAVLLLDHIAGIAQYHAHLLADAQAQQDMKLRQNAFNPDDFVPKRKRG